MPEFSAGLQNPARGKLCDLAFLTYSGFFMTIGPAVHPLTVKNSGGGGALIRDRALNRANTVVLYNN